MQYYQFNARNRLLTRNRRFLDGHDMTVDQENIQFSHLRIVCIWSQMIYTVYKTTNVSHAMGFGRSDTVPGRHAEYTMQRSHDIKCMDGWNSVPRQVL